MALGNRSHTIAVSLLFIGIGIPQIASAAVLQVGPGKMYGKPCQAIAAAATGDTIEIDASGSYAGDTCAWSTDNLTVRGVNGRPKLDITGVPPAQQKGLFAIYAPNATIENLELSGAAISAAAGNNGAGIRHQGVNLTVRSCLFHDNQNGILGAPSTGLSGQILVENSEFYANGAGDGYSHNMYIGNYATFVLRYSYSHHGKVGHLVKTRAMVSQILYNRITDEASGTASYEIDFSNGGTALVIGNVIEQSATTQNPALVSYAAEGIPAGYDSHLYVVNNTFLNNKGSGTFVNNAASTPAVLVNNIFWNGGTVTSQATAMQMANFVSATMGDPGFVNVGSYDVHLQPNSPCVDKGTVPGQAAGQSLFPAYQYVHPQKQEARSVGGGAIDIGAFEFGNPGGSGTDGGSGGTGSTDGAMNTGCSCQVGGPLSAAEGSFRTRFGLLSGLLTAACFRRKLRRKAA